MTNHWNDIDNTSLVFAFGANPAENHPACMAHVNAARFGTAFGIKQAKLIVVDPRLTRTARQCDPARGDMYVRIRPGTNVAFSNGLMKWIFDNIASYNATASANMLAYHNTTVGTLGSVGRTFVDDGGGAAKTLVAAELAGAKYNTVPTTAFTTVLPGPTATYPKYADTRFVVNALGTDYERRTLTTASFTTGPAWQFTNFPVVAPTVDSQVYGLDTVWTTLKQHLAPYDTATVADICGCTEAEIVAVAKALIDNSRFASNDAVAAQATPKNHDYKATVILYAMGQTQHTNGSQNIKDLAVLQTLMGNMGRPGGGINALRGIHNVQGSTDMGLLFDSIPAYSGNPAALTDSYPHYLNGLFGNRTEGTGAVVYTTSATLGLQQRGFCNMTNEWFGNGTSPGADVELLYAAWPKGNGVQHIKTFRNMTLTDTDPNRIISAVCWGQNPAVTEPNQSKVRAGLRNLDLLVVVDMFETETAACDRKATGITYLIPACAHVEEAGSVTNSGRWLQWRERATSPKGNSKADLELLLRFAYALDNALAFAHIRGVWGGLAAPIVPSVPLRVYAELYGKYGWTPDGVPGSFEALSTTSEKWPVGATAVTTATVRGSEVVAENLYKEICRPLNYLADGTFSPVTGGTMWIYSGSGTAGGPDVTGGAAWNGSPSYNANLLPAVTAAVGTNNWTVHNRAKSRNNIVKGNDVNGANNYPRWGWAWLLNRRVFYNNSEVSGDQADNFVSPGLVSCLFTMNVSANALADWSLVYRKYKLFADAPSVLVGPHYVSPGKTFFARFPGHTEPYESPAVAGNPAFADDYVTLFGHNMSGATRLIVEGADGTAIGAWGTGATDFPLVLTSIRCVEHFQGGPITRNNSWNVEAEPVPWIEINSVDAREYDIVDGQWVNIITARSNSTSDQMAETPDAADQTWARGFKARVGVGLQSNQRVAPGVVAIPWHWGDKGLSTGSRANDLCIDAWDANTMIPEYKACLCRIVGL